MTVAMKQRMAQRVAAINGNGVAYFSAACVSGMAAA